METAIYVGLLLCSLIFIRLIFHNKIHMDWYMIGYPRREKFVCRKYHSFGPWVIDKHQFEEYCNEYNFLGRPRSRRKPELVKSIGFLLEKRRNKTLNLKKLQSEWLPIIRIMANQCMPDEFVKAVYMGLFRLIKAGSKDERDLNSNCVEVMRWNKDLPDDLEHEYGLPLLWSIYIDHIHYYEQADSMESA